MKRPARGLALLLAAICMLGGCKGGNQQQAGNTFKIGVITSLTGPAAAFGQAHKNGYTIGLNELNAKGGVMGKKIELVYYDDQSRPDQAVQGVNKLVDQDHVPIILGAYSSENTRAIVPAVTQKQVPLLMPTATADNVIETGSPWALRICAGSGAYATTTVDFLKAMNAPKTVAIVYENTNFGQSNAQAMENAAKSNGFEVVDKEAYQASSPDYKALLQRVKAKNPAVIYFASYLLDATTLMRQAAQVNLNPEYYTSAGTGFAAAEFPTKDKGAGPYAEYTFSVSQWLPTAQWKGSKEFDEAFYKLTGSHPAYHAMEAYASLTTAAAAINKANSAQPAAIRDALKSIDLPETPFGPVKFDERGQNHHPVLITQVLEGKYKVVYPPDAAEAKPVIPAPPWNRRQGL
ncbi:MAG TPA: ABC transporter substrate-binding protein [Terriglobales bacterium]|jgi:branched-chain amino acid transport system substrate-binding protein|nr:ABC transporter substrate-binding protein [Terriglobales bacterium]